MYDDLIKAAEKAVDAAGGEDEMRSLVEGPKRGQGRRRSKRGEDASFGTLVGESVRAPRQSADLLSDWWSRWRKTASFRVLLAFVILYGLLATMRQPSELVFERSRRAEDMAFMSDFLKSYSAAGGTVLTRRPHGGTEIYPRGIVMQGEFLEEFLRAPVGGLYVVQLENPAANPLMGFYGFPPVYLAGTYFQLDRKFNLSLYRFRFLMRKDSERSGAILLTRVEPAT